jgi:hypothetical protein
VQVKQLFEIKQTFDLNIFYTLPLPVYKTLLFNAIVVEMKKARLYLAHDYFENWRC